MTKPEISVIVPIYNAKAYLPACMSGMRRQQYTKYELLLVDDGSTDGSGAVCDGYAEQDTRIRVIHQSNGGVSSARNRGLKEARGDYIVFVDADDLVRPQYLFDLIQAQKSLENKDSKTLIVSDYQPFTDRGPEERSYPEPFTIDFHAKDGLTAGHFRELIFQFRLFPPYCKLYRRDVIEVNHIRFREGMRSAEDFEFNIRYLAAADKLIYIDSVQYEYRIGYKQYVPSNRGVLGESEIKSAHIMARGITDLAKRMELFDEVSSEIDCWAANKHYYNRLRMLFMKNESVGIAEKRRLYQALISDPIYYSAAKRGASQLPNSVTKRIAEKCDRFFPWLLFYNMHRYKAEKH